MGLNGATLVSSGTTSVSRGALVALLRVLLISDRATVILRRMLVLKRGASGFRGRHRPWMGPNGAAVNFRGVQSTLNGATVPFRWVPAAFRGAINPGGSEYLFWFPEGRPSTLRGSGPISGCPGEHWGVQAPPKEILSSIPACTSLFNSCSLCKTASA